MNCNPLFWQFSCFISPPQELEWIVFVGEGYFCWLSVSGSGGFYGAILSVSKPFFNHPFSQQLHCPEIAPCINTNHVYVLHASQRTKLPLQTRFRRTTVSLDLQATRLAGHSWYSWHPCSFLVVLCISATMTSNFSAHKLQEPGVLLSIRDLDRTQTVPNPDRSETGVFPSPFPSSVTSAGPQGHLTWGPTGRQAPQGDKSISTSR